MNECLDSPSGLHRLKFKRRVLLGTVMFDLFYCVHCGEETYFPREPQGFDSKEVKDGKDGAS